MEKEQKTLKKDFNTLKKHATFSYEMMDIAIRFLESVETDKEQNKEKVIELLQKSRHKLALFGAHP